jgi:hypothetical protein
MRDFGLRTENDSNPLGFESNITICNVGYKIQAFILSFIRLLASIYREGYPLTFGVFGRVGYKLNNPKLGYPPIVLVWLLRHKSCVKERNTEVRSSEFGRILHTSRC